MDFAAKNLPFVCGLTARNKEADRGQHPFQSRTI